MPSRLLLRCSQNFSQLCSGVVSALQPTEGMRLVNSYLEVLTECREPAASWAAQGGALPAAQWRWFFSAQHWWDMPGVQVWCWAPQISSGERPAKGHNNDGGTGTSFIWGKADRDGSLSLEKRRLRGILPICTHTDGVEWMEPGFSLCGAWW